MGGPMGTRPAAQPAHDKPPLGHLTARVDILAINPPPGGGEEKSFLKIQEEIRIQTKIFAFKF